MEDGDNTIEAVSETLARDAASLRATEQPNPGYQLPEDAIVAGDWFDHETGETLTLEFPEGKYSIKNTFGELLSDENTKPIVIGFLLSLQGGGQAAEPADESALDDTMKANLGMMQAVSVERIIKMAGQALTPKDIVCLNRKLNAYYCK